MICGAEGRGARKAAHLGHRCNRETAETDDDDGADDGDGGHGCVGDGVPPVGVADALVVAIDASLVGGEPQGQDGRGEPRWRNETQENERPLTWRPAKDACCYQHLLQRI